MRGKNRQIRASIAFTFLTIGACSSDPLPQPARNALIDAPSWAQGRGFTAQYDPEGSSPLADTRIAYSAELENNPDYEVLVNAILESCDSAINDRFDAPHPPEIPAPATGCGSTGAAAVVLANCMGYRFLSLAETVLPMEVYESGLVRTQPIGDDPEAPFGSPQFVFPVPTASDAASLSVIAATYFQAAGFAGAVALNLTDTSCNDATSLETHFVDGGPDGTEAPPDVSLAFVITSGISEAGRMIGEAADVASRNLQAAAEAQRSTQRDERLALVGGWRGRHDSRLEIAIILFGAPEDLFESDTNFADPILARSPMIEMPPETDADRRAEELVRSLRIDPRLAEADLYEHVCAAMQEDIPEMFEEGADCSMDAESLLTGFGVDLLGIRQASRRILQTTAATGRPLLADPATTTVPRVVGTLPSMAPADPAFLFARTAGATRVSDVEDPDTDTHAPTPEYALRGVLNTQDYLAWVLERAIRLGFDDDATSVAERGRLLLREEIPMRVSVAIGQVTGGESCTPYCNPNPDIPGLHMPANDWLPDTMTPVGSADRGYRFPGRTFGLGGDIDHIRVRLYGAVPDEDRYELVRGEAGVQCLISGRIEGLPCDPADYTLGDPSLVTDATAMSGFGTKYLEWDWTGGGGDEPAAQEGESMYIVDLRDHISVLGFFALSGEHDEMGDTLSRHTWYAAGLPTREAAAKSLTPNPVHTEQPHWYCVGMPADLRLPLEDELTEGTEGRDDIESSWAHYVRIARQAADEADLLGEELVRHGLEMDMRAEGSRDELESLCGGVVNVGGLDADLPASTCSCPMSAAECEGTAITGPPDCGRCVLGRCLAGGLTQLLSDSPDLDSVRRCLGEPRGGQPELVNAALGDHPVCMWRVDDESQPACTCPAGMAPEDCPDLEAFPCPVTVAPNATSCSAAYGSALPDGFAVGAPSRTIGLSATGGDGAFASNCADLALLRTRWATGSGPPGWDGTDLAERVITQEFLDRPAFQQLAEVLEHQEEMFGFGSITVGGTTWATTGKLGVGRSPDGEFPCGPLIAEDSDPESLYQRVCDGSPRYGHSLLCGFASSCGSNVTLVGANNRMREAVRVLRALGGLDGDLGLLSDNGVELPDSGLLSVDQRQVPGWLRNDPRLCSTPPCFDGLLHTWSWSNDGDTFSGQCVEVTSPGDEIETEWEETFSECDFDAMMPVRRYFRLHRNPGTAYPEIFDAEDWSPRSGMIDRALAQLGADVIPTDPLVRGGYHRLLDGLELACLINQDSIGGCGADISELPEVRSPADFPKLRRMLQCAADRFERKLSRLALVDIPATLAEDLRADAVSPTFPRYRGQYGEAVANLRGGLEEVVAATRQVASNIRDFGGDLEIARGEVEINRLEGEVRAFQQMAAVSSQITRCLNSGSEAKNLWTFGGSSAIVCMDAAIQIFTATMIAEAQSDIGDLEDAGVYTRLAMLAGSRMSALSEATGRLAAAYSNAERSLTELDRLRAAARRAASRILLLDQDDTGREYNVTPVVRARMSTTRERYARAHATALRYAYLARRAVEQRLGVDMSRISREMTLVEPPATWADSLCTMPSINYDRLRDGGADVGSYAGAYVGDYVRQLEAFVESYRIDFPFQDGSDTAVVSLRDELLGARVPCEIAGPNLLAESQYSGADPAFAHWSGTCADDEEGPCAKVERVGLSPFRCERVEPQGAEVPACAERALGGAQAVMLVTPTSPSPTSWHQTVTVVPGFYMLSWYERIDSETEDDEDVDDTANLACRDDAGLAAETPRVTPTFSPSDGPDFDSTEYGFVPLDSMDNPHVERWLDACRWRRAKSLVEVTGDLTDPLAPVDVTVNLVVEPEMAETDPRVLFAAPQLERIEPWQLEPDVPLPQPFFPTDDDLRSRVGLCEDTTGAVFRGGRYWRRGCEYICPDGLGDTCAAAHVGDRALQRCYWETDFGISLTDIERGELIPSGNFALGNFNYRFDTFGVNLVGVGLQDCSRASTPTECYANASIPFSLVHAPPFRIRNHEGEIVEAPLFTGHIEHARSLAAERYITNPISGTDRTLLQDFMRRELRGRPLDGHYTLRIWEAPGFDWNRLEDVQLILNYRYWTRFE